MAGKQPGHQNISTGNVSGGIVGGSISVSGSGHSVGNTSITDRHDTHTVNSHNVYHGSVDQSQKHYEGTTVIGNNNQVGNTSIQDRHDVTIQGSFNTEVPAGPGFEVTPDVAKSLPEKWPADDHDPHNLDVKMSNEFADVVQKFEKMAAGKLKHDMYTMKSSTRGRFVMYSNRTFTAGGFKDLPVEPDEDALHALFDEMGFSCAKKLNMTREKMISDLKKEMRNSKGRSYDCFAMAVTSHGNKGVIFSSDGQEVKIQELRAIVDQTEEFHGKPKIFLIDACQGGKPNIREKGPGEDGDAVDAGPKFADNYTAVATVPSFTAGARVGFGSFFLQAVAYIFSRYACTEEINEMMTKVNHLVSLSGRQMPEYTTSLRQKLFFFPGLSK